jgi:hypothetical protein
MLPDLTNNLLIDRFTGAKAINNKKFKSIERPKPQRRREINLFYLYI